MRGLRRLLVWFGILAWVQCGMAAPLAWTFTPDGWKPEEWILVKSPRWAYSGQRDARRVAGQTRQRDLHQHGL